MMTTGVPCQICMSNMLVYDQDLQDFACPVCGPKKCLVSHCANEAIMGAIGCPEHTCKHHPECSSMKEDPSMGIMFFGGALHTTFYLPTIKHFLWIVGRLDKLCVLVMSPFAKQREKIVVFCMSQMSFDIPKCAPLVSLKKRVAALGAKKWQQRLDSALMGWENVFKLNHANVAPSNCVFGGVLERGHLKQHHVFVQIATKHK